MPNLTKNTMMPLGLVSTVVIAFVSVGLWAGRLQARVDTVEKEQEDARTVRERLASLEYKIDFLVKAQGMDGSKRRLREDDGSR